MINFKKVNNKIFKYYTVLLILLLRLGKSFSQNDTLVFQPVNNAILNLYDIRKIAVAKDGKLWLSTDNGVASFNMMFSFMAAQVRS